MHLKKQPRDDYLDSPIVPATGKDLLMMAISVEPTTGKYHVQKRTLAEAADYSIRLGNGY